MENMYAYSINYLHSGAPRTWYVIPGERSGAICNQDEFERKLQNNLFLHISSPDFVLDPKILKKQGITFYKVEQRAGDFVILLPNVYYFYFSHGVRIQIMKETTHELLTRTQLQYNIHESTRYFPIDWLITMQSYLRDETLKAPMRKALGVNGPFIYERFLLQVMRKKRFFLRGRTE
jgi:hypothetical protein